MFKIKNEWSQGKYSEFSTYFDFVLAGTGALEFSVENVEIVNTIDADLHVWLDEPNLFEKLNEILYNIMSEYILRYCEEMVHYFKVKIPGKQSYKWYKNYGYYGSSKDFPYIEVGYIGGPSINVTRLKIMGYDVADIGYHLHTSNEWMKLSYTSFGNQNSLKILTPYWFLKNHLAIVQQKMFENYINVAAIVKYFNFDVKNEDLLNLNFTYKSLSVTGILKQ